METQKLAVNTRGQLHVEVPLLRGVLQFGGGGRDGGPVWSQQHRMKWWKEQRLIASQTWSPPQLCHSCVNITVSLNCSDTRFAHLEDAAAHITGRLRSHQDNMVIHQRHLPTLDTQGVLGFKRDQMQDRAMQGVTAQAREKKKPLRKGSEDENLTALLLWERSTGTRKWTLPFLRVHLSCTYWNHLGCWLKMQVPECGDHGLESVLTDAYIKWLRLLLPLPQFRTDWPRVGHHKPSLLVSTWLFSKVHGHVTFSRIRPHAGLQSKPW